MTITRSIHRASLDIIGQQRLELFTYAKFLHVAPSRTSPNANIDIWYEVELDRYGKPKTLSDFVFDIFGTGHTVITTGQFVGTTVHPNGLVFHTFVRCSDELGLA